MRVSPPLITILITAAVILGYIWGVTGHRDVTCDAGIERAVHETEPVYPAWEYQCSWNTTVTILD